MKIKINHSEFSNRLKKYMEHTRRDLSEVLNQKSFSITTRAAKITRQADKERIRAELEQMVTTRDGRSGMRAGILVNKARGPGAGLYGRKMASAVRKLINQRRRHVSFLRAAWLPAVAVFARAIRKGQKLRKDALRWEGYGFGGATPAKHSFTPYSKFWNAAPEFAPKSTDRKGAVGFAAAGLRDSIAFEIASMERHLAKKLQETANRYKP